MDIDEAEWTETKEALLEERIPVIRWMDGDRRKGIQVCKMQNDAGQYYLWETQSGQQDVALMDSVKSNGGAHVKIGNRRLWSNSRAIVGKLLEEKWRRRGRQSLGLKPETKSWGEVIQEATLVQLERREGEGEWVPSKEPGWLVLECEEQKSVYYLDSEGRCWDEVSHKLLDADGVAAARLDEIQQIHNHSVYEKVPVEECHQKTGKAPIKVKWVDINKGDEINKEYRSRLIAKEIKMDKNVDLFAATPPSEAKNMLFSMAVTEGIGHPLGNPADRMKIDFIDNSRAYFQADAIRDMYVQLPDEDWEEGMCGRLLKSMYKTRDAAQNWGAAYSEFMKSIGFKQGKSSPCVFCHSERELRYVVHGDEFTVLGWESQVDWFWQKIKTKFLSKHRGRSGPGPSDLKSIRILNRIVEWSAEGI